MIDDGAEDDSCLMEWLQYGESVDDLSEDDDLLDDGLISELEASSYALEHSLLVESVLESVHTS